MGTAVSQPHSVPTAAPQTQNPSWGQDARGPRFVPVPIVPLGCHPGPKHRRAAREGVATRLDVEVKYGAALNYSAGERGSQDGALLFCSVINSL